MNTGFGLNAVKQLWWEMFVCAHKQAVLVTVSLRQAYVHMCAGVFVRSLIGYAYLSSTQTIKKWKLHQ